MLLHATCVAIENKGVLIAGPAGAGKSDLALRLIDEGAQLVSDDQTELKLEGDFLMAAPPASIAGLFEARHVGLMRMAYLAPIAVALYVDLMKFEEKIERLPDFGEEGGKIFLLDYPVPRLRLPSFAASTAAKIRAALKYPLVTDRA